MAKSVKILHLEDTESDAELIRREMRALPIPFEWLWVSNRVDFEKALDQYSPDIIVSDHSLRNFTSVDAFEILKNSKLDIPFILVTATISEEFAVDMMKVGITDYLLKDRLQRLPVAVATALQKWEDERESIAAEKLADSERRASELQRDKMSADLIQRNKNLEQFAYIVSHNLRAPVANILGISTILDHATLQENEKQDAIAGITLSAQKLDAVVRDLNSILQAQREMTENTEMVYFQDLVDNIQSSIYHLIQKNAARIVTDFSGAEGIRTIKSFLYSIFYNLISNSLKYRQRAVAPVIHISSSTSEGKTRLTFSDNGLGIDLAVNGDKIFGLYKRFHLETEGKGMGLFMVKTHVETLGGYIGVKSELGDGAEFTITL